MEHTPEENQALEIEKIIEQNSDAILTTVAQVCSVAKESLIIVLAECGFSEQDGSPLIWVQNESGAYGVNGFVNAEGALTEISVVRIPLGENID